MENQQDIGFQKDMFLERDLEFICQSDSRNHVKEAESVLENQILIAREPKRALAGDLIGIVLSQSNLNKAFKQVKRNKGVSGVDEVSIEDFPHWYHKFGKCTVDKIIKGDYFPSAVRLVTIPKPKGGERHLGIPTVKDRVIQQAISQVLTPIFEREFSEYSYGFRPKRSAHQALLKASSYVSEGRNIVVDMDMKSFFDEVNHDRLMSRISNFVEDKSLLLLVRRYLQSGVLIDGCIQQRTKGTPQGSPLSPLLSNIVLDELDKELERRGHCFVRYADDFSIFVRSQVAGDRVKRSISSYLTTKLRLRVNEEKSVVCKSSETQFLGYTITTNGYLVISTSSLKRLKDKVRYITKRNRGVSFYSIITKLRPVLRGWLSYFKQAYCTNLLMNLDGWIRRKLRCYRLKQCKRAIGIKRFLKQNGVNTDNSWILAASGKGWWRKSACPQAHQAMSLKWFRSLGLYNMSVIYHDQFKRYLKPPSTRVC